MQHNTQAKWLIYSLIIVGIGLVAFLLFRGEDFEIPKGETTPFIEQQEHDPENETTAVESEAQEDQKVTASFMSSSTREIFVTNNTKHSIPLDEILSGGPGKDGIPSIDEPQFISTKEADGFLDSDSPGLGVVVGETARFYPYQILVWHEIVNDTIEGEPILVTYCPLCITGVVFERRVDGEVQEFGVSGRLWKSNLLMYNRAGSVEEESLWSQVLGEAVLGVDTGKKLTILPSDTVTYGVWKKNNPKTEVLSRETGALRTYGLDPYGSYYTDDTVSFGATFNDDRLHQKEFVLGIEVEGRFKAYHAGALKEGVTRDTFDGHSITIEKDATGSVRMFIGEEKQSLPYIGGFWFSWLAAHPDTELFK